MTKSRQLKGINGGCLLHHSDSDNCCRDHRYRELVIQVPCGNDLFADGKGRFETGNLVPNANGGMDLLNGANDLTDWTITVSPTSNNPIAWYSDANRFNVKAQNGRKFVTLGR